MYIIQYFSLKILINVQAVSIINALIKQDVQIKMTSKQNITLDDDDWRILEQLNINPRIKVKELSDKLNIHRNKVTSKLSKEKKYLYAIYPDYEKLGFITAFVFSTVKPDKNNKKTAERISTFKGVEEVSVISGEWDFIIKIRAQSIEQIGQTIIEDLKNECDKTVTSFSFWSFKGENPFGLIKKEHNS